MAAIFLLTRPQIRTTFFNQLLTVLATWDLVYIVTMMLDAIEKLSGTIDATRKLLELTLDNERNRIERMELYLSIGGLGFAMMSAVGGFFGMNV